MEEGLKQKTYNAFAWDFAGKLADQGVGFIISIFLARLLMPEEFGIVAMAMVIISISHVFIDSGFGVALVQKQDLKPEHYGSVFFFNVAVGIFLTIVFYFLSPVIAKFYHSNQIEPIFKALSFTFFINSFANVQRAWLTKQLKFKTLTNSKIVSMIIGGTTGIILALKGYGVWALVVQTIISSIVANLYIYAFSGWKPELKASFQALKDLWGFGFKMLISNILSIIAHQTDNLIIGKLFSPATLGFYNRAKSLNQFVIKYTSGSLMSVFLPVLSKVKDEHDRYNAIIFKSFHVLNLVTFFLLGFLFLTIHDLIIILYTSKWLPAIYYFKILLLAGYGYPFSALLVNIITSKGNSKNFLKLEIIKQTMFFFNLAFGFIWGIENYLYINAVIVFIAVFFNIMYASKEIKVDILWFYKIILPYSIITTIIVLMISFFSKFIETNNLYMHFLIVSVTFICLFFLTTYIFKLKGLQIGIKGIKEIYDRKKQK